MFTFKKGIKFEVNYLKDKIKNIEKILEQNECNHDNYDKAFETVVGINSHNQVVYKYHMKCSNCGKLLKYGITYKEKLQKENEQLEKIIMANNEKIEEDTDFDKQC